MANPFLSDGFIWGWTGLHSWRELWELVGAALATYGWVEIGKGLAEAIFLEKEHALGGVLRRGLWRVWWGFFVYTAIWWGPLLWNYALHGGK